MTARSWATLAAWAGVVVVVVAGPGCVRYTGPARSVSPAAVESPGWLRATGVPVLRQRGAEDCGRAAAAMVSGRWRPGVALPAGKVPRGGLRGVDVRQLLRAQGLAAFVIKGELADLEHELGLGRPVIVGTVKALSDGRALTHFEVVVALHPEQHQVVTLDPAAGWRQSSYQGFVSEWSRARYSAVVTLGPASP